MLQICRIHDTHSEHIRQERVTSHITFDEATGLFVARIAYSERAYAQGAGFMWSTERRRWETPDVEPVGLAPFLKDDKAQARIASLAGDIEYAIVQSYAPGSDFDLPVPEGLSYLPYQRAGIEYAVQRKACLIGDDMGLGKGHPLWFSVWTPTGLREIGDLEVGDLVTGSNGMPTRVTGVHDRGMLTIYDVTFNDGVVVPVDADHLWQVRTEGEMDWQELVKLAPGRPRVLGQGGDGGRWHRPLEVHQKGRQL